MNKPTLVMKSAALGAVFLLVACAATPAPNASAPSAGAKSTCDALAKPAREEVGRVIDASRACTKDDDCTQVGFSTSCFDACERAIAKDKLDDVQAARNRADGAACKAFQAQGCQVVPPPCMALPKARCAAGLCT